jgi:hypothetical protein
LKQDKEKPKTIQPFSARFSLDNISQEDRPPAENRDEPEEVFQDAWGIDDDLGLDMNLPPPKEKEKEELKLNSSSNDGINPFKV